MYVHVIMLLIIMFEFEYVRNMHKYMFPDNAYIVNRFYIKIVCENESIFQNLLVKHSVVLYAILFRLLLQSDSLILKRYLLAK